MKVCTQCKRQNPADHTFCGGCGTSLAAQPRSPMMAGIAASVSVPARDDQRACIACGRINPASRYDCSECGATFNRAFGQRVDRGSSPIGPADAPGLQDTPGTERRDDPPIADAAVPASDTPSGATSKRAIWAALVVCVVGALVGAHRSSETSEAMPSPMELASSPPPINAVSVRSPPPMSSPSPAEPATLPRAAAPESAPAFEPRSEDPPKPPRLALVAIDPASNPPTARILAGEQQVAVIVRVGEEVTDTSATIQRITASPPAVMVADAAGQRWLLRPQRPAVAITVEDAPAPPVEMDSRDDSPRESPGPSAQRPAGIVAGVADALRRAPRLAQFSFGMAALDFKAKSNLTDEDFQDGRCFDRIKGPMVESVVYQFDNSKPPHLSERVSIVLHDDYGTRAAFDELKGALEQVLGTPSIEFKDRINSGRPVAFWPATASYSDADITLDFAYFGGQLTARTPQGLAGMLRAVGLAKGARVGPPDSAAAGDTVGASDAAGGEEVADTDAARPEDKPTRDDGGPANERSDQPDLDQQGGEGAGADAAATAPDGASAASSSLEDGVKALRKNAQLLWRLKIRIGGPIRRAMNSSRTTPAGKVEIIRLIRKDLDTLRQMHDAVPTEGLPDPLRRYHGEYDAALKSFEDFYSAFEADAEARSAGDTGPTDATSKLAVAFARFDNFAKDWNPVATLQLAERASGRTPQYVRPGRR